MQALRRQGINEPDIKVLEDIYKVSMATSKLHKREEILEKLK